MRLTVRLLGPLVLLLGHVTAAPAQTFTVFDAPEGLSTSSSCLSPLARVTEVSRDGATGVDTGAERRCLGRKPV